MRPLAAVLCAFALASCARVKPWERGALADPRLQTAPCPERASARSHVFSVREGAQGGQGGGGVACGCN